MLFQQTMNDVITGMIFCGTRLYMQESSKNRDNSSRSTALVLLNTRNTGGYKSLKEMIMADGESSWGDQFLHVSVPDLTKPEASNPLEFVLKAQKIIKRKRIL